MHKNTLYWQLDYQSNTGWKTKYFFTNHVTLKKYIVRYLKDKKFYAKNLTVNEVAILETLYKTEFSLINI